MAEDFFSAADIGQLLLKPDARRFPEKKIPASIQRL
jgi:hypothetical protein